MAARRDDPLALEHRSETAEGLRAAQLHEIGITKSMSRDTVATSAEVYPPRLIPITPTCGAPRSRSQRARPEMSATA